jgi:serine/threonine-protein kinase
MADAAMGTAMADLLRQQYTIEHELGRGGMAVVYLCHDLKHDRRVALKVLDSSFAALVTPARFLREIHIAASLQHPHIVPVFDSGDTGGALWYTMPYVEGPSLRDALQARRLNVDESCRIACDIGLALDYAHRHGVVHRDIKPGNILFSDEQALLADFGIAQVVGSIRDRDLTGPGLALGTPAYMSPEQAVGGRELDGRSDIYSLAIVLFEMLTGARPFTGLTPQAAVGQRLSGFVPSAAELCRRVPVKLDAVLRKALAADSANRYATARHFVDAVQGALAGSSDTLSSITIPRAPAFLPRVAHKTVAVLPFANVGMDPTEAYLVDGLTEKLIDALVHVSGIQVMGRRSSASLQGASIRPEDVARRLGVDVYVEGSVRKTGAGLRTTARLVSAQDGRTLWAEHYDAESGEISELPERIATSIAAALIPQLHAPTPRKLSARPDPKAYELLLEGRYFLQMVPQGFERAVTCYERAVGRDPGFARAHAGLAGAYFVGGLYGFLPPRDAFPRARLCAIRAIELDPYLSSAHAAVGAVSHLYDWDWNAAQSHFRRAAELRGTQVSGWGPTFLMVSSGYFEEALALSQQTLQHDPLALDSHARHAFSLVFSRRYAQAVDQCRLMLELNPTYSEAFRFMGHALELLDDLTGAREAFERAVELSHQHPWALSGLGRTYVRLGMHEDARRQLDLLTSASRKMYVPPMAYAHIHAAGAGADEAFKWLQQAIEERDIFVVFLRVNPLLDNLRADNRFDNLVRKVGIPRSEQFARPL